MAFSSEQTKPDACGRGSTSSPEDNKGLNGSKPGVEDFDEYFAQYVRHESPPVAKDWTNQYHGSDSFAFPIDDDTSSSGSNVGDHIFDRVLAPTQTLQRRHPQAYLRGTQSQEILPSHYQRFGSYERPKPAITNDELLNLEGRSTPLPLPIRTAQESSSTTLAFPPLRRKVKFGGIASKTSRPSYHSQQPSSNDWKQPFEQMQVKAPVNGFPMVRRASDVSFRDVKRPRIAFSSFDESSQRHVVTTTTHGSQERSSESRHPTQISSPQPPEWHHSSASTDSLAFTISPIEKPPDWPLDSRYVYYDNSEATQSAPALAQTRRAPPGCGLMFEGHQYGRSTNDGLLFQGNQCGHSTTVDHPNDCFSRRTDSFQSAASDTYPSLPARNHAITLYPSPPPSWPCPLPPPILTSKAPSFKSSTKGRGGHSKSNRRKPSVGMLKSSPITTLGFVNYTPNDSEKILSSVAPSGSAKTKARREQESYEEKRRMLIATEQVILDLGGDPEHIKASGLFAL